MMDTPAEPTRPQRVARTGRSARTPWARGADWTVGVTAVVLLLISLGGWLYHRSQLADIAADHLRLRVTGPAKLRPGMDNAYSVMTTSVTGAPVSAQVEFAVFAPDGKRLMLHKEETNESGRLEVTIPADLEIVGGLAVEVLAGHEGRQEKIASRLAVEPVRYAAYLATDRPLYRPGETLHYRALVPSRFRFSADRRLPVAFEVLGPGGAPVAGLEGESVVKRGGASGWFLLPDGLAGGKYTLVARSIDGAFPDERRSFFVHRYRTPELVAQLDFNRSAYRPGDTVTADFSARRAQGGPAAGAKLKVEARVAGQTIHEQSAEASEQGTLRMEFKLPEKVEGGEGHLIVAVDDGGARQTVAAEIPLRLGPVDVQFFPEGGTLVADLENRVYLAARDRLGRPVDVRGTVVDGQGGRVVGVATSHRGMGAFSFVPRPGEQYGFVLANTAGEPQVVPLPDVSANHSVVLSAGLGVFQEGKPLEFNVRATHAGMPLVAAAWCRGMPVGQRLFVTNQSEANPVSLPLDEEAEGVIRLTIYDYSVRPPEPVAERLVYRPPAGALKVEVEADAKRGPHAPGDTVELSLATRDETGDPVPAVLGLGLAPESLLALERAPSMPVHFLLGTEVDRLEALGDSEFYLSESREAAVALDLLLGTQGWRRFLESRLDGREDKEPRLNRVAALGARANPPAVFDNLVELQQRYRENLAKYRAHRTRASNALTALSFFGGVGLVMLVAMLNLLNVAGGARLWATAIVTATACLIVGGILMDPGRWKSPPEATTAYVPFDMAPESLPLPAEADEPDETSPKADALQPNGDAAVPGVLRSGEQGQAQAEAITPGGAGRYRVFAEGVAEGGRIGRGTGETSVHTPLTLAPQLPSEVGVDDRIDLPLAISNHTDGSASLKVALEHGRLLALEEAGEQELELKPHRTSRCFFPMKAEREGSGMLTFRATGGQLADEVTCAIRVVAPPIAKAVSEADAEDAADVCPVRLSTRLDTAKIPWGRITTLTAEVSNTTGERQPMTVAELGLPAGLEVELAQLEKLVRAGAFDYYETRPRRVLCYWRTLAPDEAIRLTLDLTAAVPGRFTGPPPCAYLHDDGARKCENEPLSVEITRD